MKFYKLLFIIAFINFSNVFSQEKLIKHTVKKGETISFLFPSHMAYGYHGDDDKIGTNQPIICTVTLNDIKLDTQTKN